MQQDYITTEQMAELTGYKQPSKQCNVLNNWGIRYFTRHDGRPQTTWTLVNGNGNGMPAVSRQKPLPASASEPDFSGLKGC